jgi:hypothetical protein
MSLSTGVLSLLRVLLASLLLQTLHDEPFTHPDSLRVESNGALRRSCKPFCQKFQATGIHFFAMRKVLSLTLAYSFNPLPDALLFHESCVNIIYIPVFTPIEAESRSCYRKVAVYFSIDTHKVVCSVLKLHKEMRITTCVTIDCFFQY